MHEAHAFNAYATMHTHTTCMWALAGMSKDEALEFLEETYGAPVQKQLKSASWKERLAGVADILERMTPAHAADAGARTCRALTQVPGWKDSNFQVRCVPR
jgi:hypothetical protein